MDKSHVRRMDSSERGLPMQTASKEEQQMHLLSLRDGIKLYGPGDGRVGVTSGRVVGREITIR